MIGLIGTILSNIVLMSDGIKKAKEDNDSINIAKKFNNPTYTDARGNCRLVATRQKVYEYINANGDLQIDDMKTGQVIQIIKRNVKERRPKYDFLTAEKENEKNKLEAIENNKFYYTYTDCYFTHKMSNEGNRIIDEFVKSKECRRTADDIAVIFRKEMEFTKYGNLFIGYNKNGTDENGKLCFLKRDKEDNYCELARYCYDFYCKAVEYNLRILNNERSEEYYIINDTTAEWYKEKIVNEIINNNRELIITEKLSFEEFIDKYINYCSGDYGIYPVESEHLNGGRIKRTMMPEHAMSKWAWETEMYPQDYLRKHKEEIEKILTDEWKIHVEYMIKMNKAEKERRNA